MEQFGEYLKAQREKKGIRLEEIASITKIHLHSLELLEGSRWDSLPPEPFLRGFIIAYAKYVGLDPKEVLARYLEAMVPHQGANGGGETFSREAKPLPMGEEASDLIQQSSTLLSRKVLGAVLGLVLFAIVGAFIYVGKRAVRHDSPPSKMENQTTSAPPQSDNTGKIAPSSAGASSGVEMTGAEAGASNPPTPVAEGKQTNEQASLNEITPPPAAPNAEGKQELVVEVKHRSWAKVIADDKDPTETTLEAGEKVTYNADSKIKLILGNAAGATILHNGEPAPGVKYDGTIRFYTFPPRSRFAQEMHHETRRVTTHSNTEDEDASEEN